MKQQSMEASWSSNFETAEDGRKSPLRGDSATPG